jgi:hypothetical protein
MSIANASLRCRLAYEVQYLVLGVQMPRALYFFIITILGALSTQNVRATEQCTLTECQSRTNATKTPYEKVMDQRRLNVINQLWMYYWTRNQFCMSDTEKKRITLLMERIKYPQIKVDQMSSAQIRNIILRSVDSLSRELEIELYSSCNKDSSFGNEAKIRGNLDYLQSKLVQVIDSQPYWLWDKPEFQYAEARRNRIPVGQR